jgi:hypothetical protein
MLTPLAGKMLLLGTLCAVWLGVYRRVARLDTEQTYHLAAYERDRRKARFYYLSVWIGLAVAFLSFLSLDAMANLTFDSAVLREWTLTLTRTVGVWGLLVIGAVWMLVGQRVSQPNSDGQSLIPLRENRKNRE